MKRLFIILALLVVGLVACGKADDDTVSGESNDDIKKVKIAYVQSSKPMTYTDDNGEATGYDVEVLRAVEEKLPDYEFEFVGTTDDDLLIGVEQGKFQAGVKNAFFTEERTKKFLYPEEFIGLSSIGFVLKKENEHIKTLEDFANANFTLAPIAANNAQYTVIETYNNENPDNPINLEAGDVFSLDVVQWVLEDRVEGGIIIEGSFNRQVLNEDAPYNHLKDDVVYNEFAVIETWPLFNKEEQAFADAFDQAIKEVKEEKITNELSEQFYGKDLFELLE